MTGVIDTDRFSAQLRTRGIDRAAKTIAVSKLTGSEQENDLSEPVNCDGYGRIRHFRLTTSAAWPANPLPIVPAANALGMDPADTIRAQVFQNAVCNWRCWYCFVDFPLLVGDPEKSAMLSAEQLVNLYLAENDPPSVLDLSGGQPDLVPEWVAWMLAELRSRESKAYVWSDDNLSNDYFFSKLTASERRAIDDDSHYGKVCCFKGFDSASFSFNTQAAPELFERQFTLMDRLLKETPIDLYAYATFTAVEARGLAQSVVAFVDRLEELDRNLPLRTVPLEVSVFTPVLGRLTDDRCQALTIQQEAIAIWSSEIASRYSESERSAPICEVPLRG